MTIYLRQSTASQEVPLGYFVDSTDGNTEETGLTIANTDIKIWKTGATTLANKNSGGATHISNGIYYAVLDATDTDTIGPLVIFCHPSGALATKVNCCVLDETVYDVLFGTVALATATNITAAAGVTLADGAITAAKIANDAITDAKVASDVTIASVTGSVGSVATGGITASSFGAGAIDNAAIAADAIGSSELAATAASEIAAAVRTELATELARIDAATSTRASQTSLDTLDDYVDTEVAAIKAKTDNLPSDPADASDIASAFSTVNATLATIAGYIDTEVAAIKAKTDNLPSDPADASDIAASFNSLAATLSAIAGYIDTEVAAIKAKTDNLPASPAATGDAMTLTAGERTSVADALLNRDMGAVSDSNARSPLNALRFLRNKWDVAGGTLTVKKEDDSTTAWTAAVSTDAAAAPVVGNDPT